MRSPPTAGVVSRGSKNVSCGRAAPTHTHRRPLPLAFASNIQHPTGSDDPIHSVSHSHHVRSVLLADAVVQDLHGLLVFHWQHRQLGDAVLDLRDHRVVGWGQECARGLRGRGRGFESSGDVPTRREWGRGGSAALRVGPGELTVRIWSILPSVEPMSTTSLRCIESFAALIMWSLWNRR